MTTLTFALSRAIGRELKPGDEALITKLDHDANRAPWLAVAERGIVVKEVDFDPADCTLRLDPSTGSGHVRAQTEIHLIRTEMRLFYLAGVLNRSPGRITPPAPPSTVG
jgi:selenocysteine lyase/cysteine desulfurase